ncbi:hypothetical protein [Streptococcus hyointestinalis]|nr:hypothetical protein [Streptococcus hyointestinalis]
MSCTNGCNDCKCEPIEIKDKTTTIRDFSDKLRVLNEFGCLISITPCSQLGKIVAKYSFYLWCYLKDVLRLLENMLDRMDHFLTKEEAEKLYQRKLKAGNGITIDGDTISAESVDVSGFARQSDLEQTNQALMKIIANLKASGAWQGDLNGSFVNNRNIATGNINIFGGGTDSSSFIRTNNGQTENDLAGGVD